MQVVDHKGITNCHASRGVGVGLHHLNINILAHEVNQLLMEVSVLVSVLKHHRQQRVLVVEVKVVVH